MRRMWPQSKGLSPVRASRARLAACRAPSRRSPVAFSPPRRRTSRVWDGFAARPSRCSRVQAPPRSKSREFPDGRCGEAERLVHPFRPSVSEPDGGGSGARQAGSDGHRAGRSHPPSERHDFPVRLACPQAFEVRPEFRLDGETRGGRPIAAVAGKDIRNCEGLTHEERSSPEAFG